MLPFDSFAFAGRRLFARVPRPSIWPTCLIVAAVGCADAPLSPRPLQTGANANRIGSPAVPTDPASRLGQTPGACFVSARRANGGYPAALTALSLPPSLKNAKAAVAQIAYRGWSPGIAVPTLVAICNYPDLPGAREYVAGELRARNMSPAQLKSFALDLGVAEARQWSEVRSEFTHSPAASTYLVDGAASDFPLRDGKTMQTSGICDDPQPGCDNYGDPPPDPPPGGGSGGSYLICDTWAPECDEVVPEITAAEAVGNDASISTANSSAPYICVAKLDYPHKSGTVGYLGNINVHAWTQCPVPSNHVLYLNLRRKQCVVWVFCWWYTIGTNAPAVAGSGTSYFEVNAASACSWRTGVFKGESYHQVWTLDGTGYGAENASSPAVNITCWP